MASRTGYAMETILERTQGKVRVVVNSDIDDYPDYSYLGEFATLAKADPHSATYWRREHAVRPPGSDLWRDERGRIVVAPTSDDDSRREYGFIALGDNYRGDPKALTYCFQDATRLEGLERGDWCYLAIIARVYVSDREVGAAVVGGFESDSGELFIRQQANEIAHEAISDARAWLDSLKVSA